VEVKVTFFFNLTFQRRSAVCFYLKTQFVPRCRHFSSRL